MSLVKNKVISNAVREKFPNETAILQLGVMDTNRDLSGKGVGDTVQLTTFDNISEDLQHLEKGDRVKYEELSSTSKDVKVKQFVKGIKIFDQDVKFSVGGGSLEGLATKQLTDVFSRGIDTAAMDTLLKSDIDAVDATSGLTTNLIMDNVLKHFGENAFEKAGAIVVPSVVASQLLLKHQHNIVKASEDGYNSKYRFEIGRLFNQIPIIMSDRVKKEEVDGDNIYKSLVVHKNALTYVLAEDVKTESDRDISEKCNYFNSDIIYAMAKHKDSIILNTTAQ